MQHRQKQCCISTQCCHLFRSSIDFQQAFLSVRMMWFILYHSHNVLYYWKCCYSSQLCDLSQSQCSVLEKMCYSMIIATIKGQATVSQSVSSEFNDGRKSGGGVRNIFYFFGKYSCDLSQSQCSVLYSSKCCYSTQLCDLSQSQCSVLLKMLLFNPIVWFNTVTMFCTPENAVFNTILWFVQVEHCTFGLKLLPYAAALTQLRKDIRLLPIKKIPLKLHVMSAHLKERYERVMCCYLTA